MRAIDVSVEQICWLDIAFVLVLLITQIAKVSLFMPGEKKGSVSKDESDFSRKSRFIQIQRCALFGIAIYLAINRTGISG